MNALQHTRPRATRLPVLLVLLIGLIPVMLVAWPSTGFAQTTTPPPCPPIVIDGMFADWACPPFVSDPPFDCKTDALDLSTFAMANNPNDPTAYFMVERGMGANAGLRLRLRVDTNNNGLYNEPADRLVTIVYRPRNGNAQVDVELFDGAGAFLATIARKADWGESRAEGARRVEWPVTFAQLGIAAGQPIRLSLESFSGGGSAPACDTVSEVQWSPADALGFVLLALLVGAGAAWMAHRRGMA